MIGITKGSQVEIVHFWPRYFADSFKDFGQELVGCYVLFQREVGRIIDSKVSSKGDVVTLPKTNSSPLKIGLPKRKKRKLVFQPSIFRCELLVLGRVVPRRVDLTRIRSWLQVMKAWTLSSWPKGGAEMGMDRSTFCRPKSVLFFLGGGRRKEGMKNLEYGWWLFYGDSWSTFECEIHV